MSLDDRPRGILSEADRKYLKNPDEYSKQAGYERRQAIIERVHEALYDFPLLLSRFDKESRARAFSDIEPDNREDVIDVLPSVFAFLYLGIADTVEPADIAKDTFEDAIADGIRQAYHVRGYSLNRAGADIEVERGAQLKDLQEREDISFAEALQLYESGDVSNNNVIEALLRALESDRLEEGADAFSTIENISLEKEGEEIERAIDLDETDEVTFVIQEVSDENTEE
jgi:hypothetical protein